MEPEAILEKFVPFLAILWFIIQRIGGLLKRQLPQPEATEPRAIPMDLEEREDVQDTEVPIPTPVPLAPEVKQPTPPRIVVAPGHAWRDALILQEALKSPRNLSGHVRALPRDTM